MKKRQVIILATAALVFSLVAAASAALLTPRPGFPGTKAILDHPLINESVVSRKGTVIYFSASSCPACMLQDVSMDAAYSEYSQQVNFVYLRYSQELAGVFQDWSVIKVPTSIFIDKDGIVVSRHDGTYLDAEDLKKEIARIK
ncbi:MAG: thioredoxin domain-containing protein [Candidatus Verstraetearchaeota archaeon]|nr:thioredoxin domain-containing protein [Candidatus Verstraetearchaeota archaeon]